MPPGWTVRTSVVHASVASSIAAWMRDSPSRTRIAAPSAGPAAACVADPSPAYRSTAATAAPTRRWLALTSSYTPRSSRVMTSCGAVGTSQSMSSGSGCSRASSSRHGTGSASARGTRPRRTAREYTRSPASHSRSAPCGCSSVPCPAIAHPTPGFAASAAQLCADRDPLRNTAPPQRPVERHPYTPLSHRPPCRRSCNKLGVVRPGTASRADARPRKLRKSPQ